MKLYFSPYSKDVVRMLGSDVGLICSTSQVNSDGGYTGFTQQSLRDFVGPKQELAMDHLGKNESRCDVVKVIKDCVAANFDYIHLHTLDLELIQYCFRNFNIHFELGTGEDLPFETTGEYLGFLE